MRDFRTSSTGKVISYSRSHPGRSSLVETLTPASIDTALSIYYSAVPNDRSITYSSTAAHLRSALLYAKPNLRELFGPVATRIQNTVWVALKCVGVENVRPGTLASDIIVLRASFIFGIHAGKMPAAQMPGAQVPAAKVPAGKAVETLR